MKFGWFRCVHHRCCKHYQKFILCSSCKIELIFKSFKYFCWWHWYHLLGGNIRYNWVFLTHALHKRHEWSNKILIMTFESSRTKTMHVMHKGLFDLDFFFSKCWIPCKSNLFQFEMTVIVCSLLCPLVVRPAQTFFEVLHGSGLRLPLWPQLPQLLLILLDLVVQVHVDGKHPSGSGKRQRNELQNCNQG